MLPKFQKSRMIVVFMIIALSSVCAIVWINTDPNPVEAVSNGVNLPRDGRAFERLSDYGLFTDFATQTPSPGVVPYDIATPLFTDYASKYRFVYVPDGRAAQYDPERMFAYPVGTILVKTFGYLNDIRDPGQGEELIETRLLIRGRRGWDAWTYVYDAETNDAVLTIDGARRQMTWTHYDGTERSINYVVPTVKDCRSCHNENYDVVPIGPKAWNLNRDFEYDHGTENQLARWTELGILEGAPEPDTATALPVWGDPADGTLDQRARAYLEVNCAHCHNPNGPADKSTMDLRWTQSDPFALGVGRRPVEGGEQATGEVDESILRELLSFLDEDRDRGRDDGRRGGRDRDRRGERDRNRDDDSRDDDLSGWDRPWAPDDFDWGGRDFIIAPGKPDESIMVYRMESLDPRTSMPKVPHFQVHDEGAALIREWILAMDGDLE